MKPSTIFAVTVALLLSLGVAVSAKMLGVFEKKAPIVEDKQEPIKILVAKQNIYEGIAMTADMVMVRPLQPSELAHYQQHKDKYLSPSTSAAHLRIPLKNIEAGQPILRDYLEDLALPDGVPLRLSKGMRAINMSLPKGQAGGGMIAKGDRVDVLMTSKICDGEHCDDAVTLSAFIARDLRVVAKRNTLFTVLASNPDDKPVHYTLEANPYRAALIESAMAKGMITLLPTPASRETPQSGPIVPTSAEGGDVGYAQFDSPEYRDEDSRVAMFLRGQLAVGDADLERIFQLRPIDRRPPPPPPFSVKHVSGIAPQATSYFSDEGKYLGSAQMGNGKADAQFNTNNPEPRGTYRPVVQGQKPMGYSFKMPDCCAVDGTRQGVTPGGHCESCEKNKKK